VGESPRGRYPDSLEALLELDSEGKPHLWAARRSFPADYWGHPFAYSPPALGATPRVVSYGADGEPGGWGEDADIDSATLENDG
jgi:general secretion pathway protein G